MKPVENQTVLDQLKWRYSTQKFDPSRKIPDEDWKTLEASLIATASSFGLQPWHFVVITSQKIKDELVPAAYGQTQLSQASHVVVFAVKKDLDAAHVQKHVDRTAEVRGVPVEKLERFKGSMLGTIASQDSAVTQAWCAHQVYIALGFLLTCAAMLGIDACPMEGIQPERFDQILGLNEKGFTTLVIATLGYRAEDDTAAMRPKVRFKAEDVVTRMD